jgi:hypothetical protein
MKLTVERKLTPAEVAQAFCELDDDQMAQVFVEAAKIEATWSGPGFMGPGWQWYAVGRHLRTCSCSTEDARDMVREIAKAIDPEE